MDGHYLPGYSNSFSYSMCRWNACYETIYCFSFRGVIGEEREKLLRLEGRSKPSRSLKEDLWRGFVCGVIISTDELMTYVGDDTNV